MNFNEHRARGEGRRNQRAAIVDRFSDCVFEESDLVEFRLLPSRDRNWCDAAFLAFHLPQFVEANRVGENVYLGVNPRLRRGGTAADVALARCIFSDWDGIDLDGARVRWGASGLPEPTMLISSGGGVHAYWRLTDPLADLAEWRSLQRALIAAVGSDPTIHDPPRVMRLPGFYNHKYAPPVPCRIVAADPGRRYQLAELHEILSPHLQVMPPAIAVGQSPAHIVVGSQPTVQRVARCLAAMLRVPFADGNDGSQRLLSVARQAVRYDLDDGAAVGLIRNYAQLRPFPKARSDQEIIQRLRDAENRCQRGEAL